VVRSPADPSWRGALATLSTDPATPRSRSNILAGLDSYEGTAASDTGTADVLTAVIHRDCPDRCRGPIRAGSGRRHPSIRPAARRPTSGRWHGPPARRALFVLYIDGALGTVARRPPSPLHSEAIGDRVRSHPCTRRYPAHFAKSRRRDLPATVQPWKIRQPVSPSNAKSAATGTRIRRRIRMSRTGNSSVRTSS
jgi:hypothetical protein